MYVTWCGCEVATTKEWHTAARGCGRRGICIDPSELRVPSTLTRTPSRTLTLTLALTVIQVILEYVHGVIMSSDDDSHDDSEHTASETGAWSGLEVRDREGKTPLFRAAERGQVSPI